MFFIPNKMNASLCLEPPPQLACLNSDKLRIALERLHTGFKGSVYGSKCVKVCLQTNLFLFETFHDQKTMVSPEK